MGSVAGGLRDWAALPVEAVSDKDQARIEICIRAVAETSGGVLLGRGATIVPADTPGVFHVRLDGPPDRRVRQAMTLADVDATDARGRQHETDRARARVPGTLPRHRRQRPRLYHLIIDSTALALATSELIVIAAATFWAAAATP